MVVPVTFMRGRRRGGVEGLKGEKVILQRRIVSCPACAGVEIEQ